MTYPDPSQYPQPGTPYLPGNRAPESGPLAGIQDQVASVLNGNGNNPDIYIPAGPMEPVFQVPNIWYLLASFFGRLFRR